MASFRPIWFSRKSARKILWKAMSPQSPSLAPPLREPVYWRARRGTNLQPGICGPKPDADKPTSKTLDSCAASHPSIMGRLPPQPGKVECSLVTHVAKTSPGTSFGHIVQVPGFGRVSLASLTVDQAFHLTIVTADPGQPGGVPLGGTKANGNTRP